MQSKGLSGIILQRARTYQRHDPGVVDPAELLPYRLRLRLVILINQEQERKACEHG